MNVSYRQQAWSVSSFPGKSREIRQVLFSLIVLALLPLSAHGNGR